MANDKKFIVKNGLQTGENVLIGTSTDDGANKLQVTGNQKVTGKIDVTQSSADPSLKIENSNGTGSEIAEFIGQSGSLQITDAGPGDYKIYNSSGATAIQFDNTTGTGLKVQVNDTDKITVTTLGANFDLVPKVAGVAVWYPGNDGAGSGLDADLLDGIDSANFLRSDEDDTMNGSLTITGDLTVSGTTTTVNTQQMLIADNIFTLNSDFTTGTPTENAGFEILRGGQANSELIWDETNDWWKLISAGTDLGRIITTADEGSGNGFDADTVDGLEAAQFIRSDVNDIATGNLELRGTVTIGDETGSALLTMKGAGNNRSLSSDNGKIGFLDGAFAYSSYQDASDNWNVKENVIAKTFVDVDDNTYVGDFSGTSTFNSVNLEGSIIHNGDADTFITFPAENQFEVQTGGVQRLLVTDTSITSSVDFRASRFVDADDTSYLVDPAGESIMHAIGLDDDLFHNDNVDTKLSFGTDTIALDTDGTTRLSVLNTHINATVDIRAPQFVDADDTGYYGNFAGTSVMNTVGINDTLFHNGNAGTNLLFGADQIDLKTNNVSRLTLTNALATFAQNVRAPRYEDADNNAYYGDFAGTSVINSINLEGSIFHNGDADTSITFSGANQFRVTTGGTARLTVNNDNTTFQNKLIIPEYIEHAGDSDASFGFSAADTFQINALSGVGINKAPTAALSIKQSATMGSNPFVDDNKLLDFSDADTTDLTIRGDSFRNIYNVMDGDGGYYINDSGANFILSVDTGTGDVIIGDQSATIATGDFTPVLAGAKTANKLHVNGSVQLNGQNDALVIGSGTSTFLRKDELGFGQGGGFLMDSATTIKVRGNKILASTGDASFARYLDANDETYYGDFAATSRINNVDLVGSIRHEGDTDTLVTFGANQVNLTAGGTSQFNVYQTYAEATTDLRAPLFSDSADTDYSWNPNTSSAHRFSTPSGYIDMGAMSAAEANFTTDRAKFKFSSRVDFDGGIYGHATDDYANFERFVDFSDAAYYGEFAGISQMKTIDLDDYIRHRGDVDTYMGFSAADTFKVFTGGTERLNIDNNSVDFNVDVYAPRYYDSNNNSFYLDPASTSITNVIRTNEIQIETGDQTIELPSGPKGTIMVEGERDGYAGYMISNDWGFISSGSTEMGLYNETDNEWSLLANRNNFTRLYSNNIHQIGAENGYGFAPSRMRSPLFEDSNNTAFYADMAGQTRLKSIKAGDSAISNTTTFPLEAKSAQRVMFAMQNTGADANYPRLVHDTRNARSAMILNFNSGVAGNDRFWFEENGNFQAYGAGIFGSLALNGGNEDLGLLKTYGAGYADLKMFDGTDYWDKRVIQPMQGSENNATAATAEYVKNNSGPFSSTYALRSSGYRDFDSDYIPVEPGEEIYAEIAARFVSGSGGLLYLGVRRYDKDKKPIATNDGIVYFAASAVDVTSTSWTTYSGYHTLPTSHTVFNGSDGGAVKYVRLVALMNYSAGGAVREFGPPILKRTNVKNKLVVPSLVAETDIQVDGDLTIDGTTTGNAIIGTTIDANRFRDRNNTAYYVEPAGPSKVAGTWDWTNGAITNLNNLTFNDPGPGEGIKWNGGYEWQIYESPNDLTTQAPGNLQFTTGAGNGTHKFRITSNGDAETSRYMRAQRFYDVNDAAYYVDPASTSIMDSIRINEYIQHNGDTDTFIRMRADDMQLQAGGRQMLRMSEDTDPDRLRFVTDTNWTDSNGDWNMSRNVTIGGTATATNSFYGPRFYDSDDNAYYGDFAGTTLANIVRANQLQIDGSTFTIDSATGGHGSIKVAGNTGGYAGYAINDDWVFMSSGAAVSGIYNDTNDQWSLIARQQGDTELYWGGTEQASTKNGYFLGINSLRSPIWEDVDNTAYRINGNGTSRLLTLQVDNAIQGNIDGYSTTLLRKDNRIIEPNEDPAGRLTFGFTSWDNNDTSPYADYLHLRSFTDASGGSDNLLMFKKSGRGMRLWQQTWNSGTAYSAYSDIAIYNSNPGNTPFYASRYYDSNDTAYWGDFAGTSIVNDIQFRLGGEAQFQSSAGTVRGFIQATETDDAHLIIATTSGEDISFRDNGLAGDWNMIIRGDGQTLFRSSTSSPQYYDRDDTNYYGNFAGTSVMHTLDIRSEVYNDGWFRNDTSGRGLYSTPNAMHFASTGNNRWVSYSNQDTSRIDIATSGNNRRGAIYANNSNEMGILSQDDGWALRTTNGVVDSHHSFYAPIMYDRDDSNYYVNPASQSHMNTLTLAGNRIGFVNSSFDAEIRVSDDNPDGTGATFIFYGDGVGYNAEVATEVFRATRHIRAPIYYDSNDANFYANPASTSVFNTIDATIFRDRNDTGRYVDPASTSQMGTVEVDRLNMRDMGDWVTFYGDNSDRHAISSRNASGSNADDLRINSYGSVFINLDSNANNTSGADFMIGRHGQGTDSIANSDLFRVYGDAMYVYSNFSFRAPIFYDSDDTTYYVNPSADSVFNTSVRANELYARNWFRNDNSGEGIYNQNTGVHAYSYQSQYYAVTGNNNDSAISLQLRSTYNGNIRMWLHGASNYYCGYLNTAGQWLLRTRMADGYSPAIEFREEGNETWTGNPGNDVGKIEYHSNRFYIVAGGNSNRIVQFRQNGTDRSYIANDGVFVGTATSARWADLAERYEADAIYGPGYILGIGGDKEVTLYQPGMPVAGAVSTNPAYRMNEHISYDDDDSVESKMNPFVALKGRIPVLINGDATKGQWIIADRDGKGRAVDYGTPGINSFDIIGIAISDSENGEVEVKV